MTRRSGGRCYATSTGHLPKGSCLSAPASRQRAGEPAYSRCDPDGQWDGGACFPQRIADDWRAGIVPDFSDGQPWTSTLPTLVLLRDLGLDPASAAARETIPLVATNCRWEHDGQAFFDGEVEACINGRTLSIGANFGADVDDLVTGLLADQLDDGGWNCWTEHGATVSSFDSTICVLEGLLEY